jgi:putative ABC transport system substrate-binding protein
MPVIGCLNPTAPEAFAEPMRGLRQGLKDVGYVEGENLTIEYRWPRAAPLHCPRWPPIWYAVGLP